MQTRTILATLLISGSVIGLIAAAVSQSALPVMTVDQLVHPPSAGQPTNAKAIRLGARVADEPIDYKTSDEAPRFRLAFTVRDIVLPESKMPVVYYGIMPDTLKNGRDVILEGSFDGSTFAATDIKTQCPSKYEPPVPGASSGARSYGGQS